MNISTPTPFSLRLTRICLCALTPLFAAQACRDASPAAAPPRVNDKAPAKAVAAEPARGKPLEPPPLPVGTSGCFVRRLNKSEGPWQTQPVAFDPTTRTIEAGGGPRRFDEQGRLISLGSTEPGLALQRYRYDGHGNPLAWTEQRDDHVVRGRRWDSTYEGTPARTLEVRIADYAGSRDPHSPAHTTQRYRYEADGQLTDETTRHADGRSWTRTFRWQDGRLHAIEWRLAPRPTGAALDFDAHESFTYDPAGRLSTYAQDGEALGEAMAADGKPDEVKRFEYEADGRLVRIERDGHNGDVAPAPPDGEADALVLLTPECDPVRRLWPEFFGLPDPMLPATVPVHWR